MPVVLWALRFNRLTRSRCCPRPPRPYSRSSARFRRVGPVRIARRRTWT